MQRISVNSERARRGSRERKRGASWGGVVQERASGKTFAVYLKEEDLADVEADAGSDEDVALNDNSDYQHCFVCGARNLSGLRLTFRREGEQVVAEFLPGEAFEGFPGVVHGGILASLLDETLARTAAFSQQWVMTGRLEIRYRRPALIGQLLRITGQVEQRRARMLIARGAIVVAA